MKALCTLSRSPNRTWVVRHSSSSLGTVEVSAPSGDQAPTKMREELQRTGSCGWYESFRLNDIPMSALRQGRSSHGFPRKVFAEMVSGVVPN